MTYIENIFLCMVSPLLVAALCMGRRHLRFFLFCIVGMGVCLLSAYINTFLASVCQADALAATAEIAPVVEEMMKLLPLVFYLLVFEPEGDKIKAAAITVALAFATFENVCYLIQNGADRFSFIFFRGFGTGAMHVLCGLIVGGGLAYAWQRTWLKIAGTWGLLGAAITLHAVYNLLIAYGGAAQYVAYALPVLLVAAGRLSTFRLSRMKYPNIHTLRAAFLAALKFFLENFEFWVRVFPILCTYISERVFRPQFQTNRRGGSNCMYDTARRVALVRQRVRKNTRRRQQHGIYGLSAACMLLFAVLMQAISTVVRPGQTAAWGVFGAMLLREDAGGYVLVAVVSFAAAAAITALCMRFRIRENRKKGGTGKPDPQEQEGKTT